VARQAAESAVKASPHSRYFPKKARLARETFDRTGVTDVIRLVEGDYLDHADEIREVAFCFLDAKRTCTSPVTT